MQALVAFIVLCFVIGGSRHGALVRRRPILLLAISAVAAASFYSLRVA